MAEVEGFKEIVNCKTEGGVRGHDLVNEVLFKWESIVFNEVHVARREIGEKIIVCGRAVKWWDSEIKEKIKYRREVHKK